MRHVLIIEDEWIIAEHLAGLIDLAGATSIAMAFTEREAIYAAIEHRPDVIISDVKLAAGTGPCAVRSITDKLGYIPTIFITATPKACQPCDPASIILSKPVNPELLMGHFRRLARI